MSKIILASIVLVLALLSWWQRDAVFGIFTLVEVFSTEHPWQAALLLVAMQSLSGPLGFPGTPLTLLSGSLFGVVLGASIALIGNTIGATLAFILSRYVFRDYVQNKTGAKYPKLKSYDERLETRAWSTVVALRLIPLFPFNALNFLLGITRVPLRVYILATFFGMIPGTTAFVYFGNSLRLLDPINITIALLGIVALTFAGKAFSKKF
jgi:uncharacterized membrane protein YdjX (TVP38/TMEM64 family)